MSQSTTNQPPHSASISTYVIGFGIALALTALAFALVVWEVLSGFILIGTLLTLAAVQTTVHLWFFLHLGREERPHWNTIFLLNTIGIILLIVIASIWVMNSLHYRMMSPEEIMKYMLEEGQKGF